VISTGQILAAAVVTGTAAAIAAAARRWSLAATAAAAASSFALIVLWRAIANLLGVNGDFLPAVSVGDVGCLLAGALGPAAVAPATEAAGHASSRDWVPAAVGGAIGFLINVIIL